MKSNQMISSAVSNKKTLVNFSEITKLLAPINSKFYSKLFDDLYKC